MPGFRRSAGSSSDLARARLRVRVRAGAGRSRVVGLHGAGVKVEVRAPPERGRANAEVREVLAAALGLPVSALSLLAGAAAREKIWLVEGLSEAEALARLAAAG